MLTKDANAKRLSSRVEEITPSYMVVAMPVAKSVPVLLHPGTTFYGRVVKDGVVWRFTSDFIDKRAEPVAVWIITPPCDFEKIQLRDYVRMETALTAEVQRAGSEEPAIPATTKDISGGGALIVSKLSASPGTKLKINIDLAGAGRIFLNAEVVRAEKDHERKIYYTGIKFIDIPERERDKIIKYIFKRQLERRQKGFEV